MSGPLSWQRIALAFAGIGAITIGAIFPAAGVVLIPAGTGLLGLALPTPGGKRPEDPPASTGKQ